MLENLNVNVRNLFSTIGANVFVIIVGIIQAFLFPKLMSPSQYGYWSAYLLYTSYAGFFNLGISDGIYLLLGGKDYNELEMKKIKTYFNIVLFYLSCFLVLWFSYSFITQSSTTHILFLLSIGISTFLACLRNFVVSIDQATSRFNIYSRGHVIEKIVIMLGSIVLIKWNDAFVVIISSIIGRIFTVIYYYANSKFIFINNHFSYKEAIKDMKFFLVAGIWLTLAALGITAMTGTGRIIIQYNFGVEELGYYSFILSISGLFTIFFSSIATVLFPMFRKTNTNLYKKYMVLLDDMLDWVGVFILLLYYPSKILLRQIYPQYIPALGFLAVLFPLVVQQGRTSIIYYTIYKVERLEKIFVKNLFLTLLIGLLITLMACYFYQNLTSIAVATYISFVILSTINVTQYNKVSEIKLEYHVWYLMLTLIYLVVSLIPLSGWGESLLIYAICVPAFIYKTIRIKPTFKKFQSFLKN